ncbi:V-type proton ATPase subunit e-like protein [Coleophoma crateriformis]|uniref:V-type proton ATPase subunit e-like protein n=1 Tax=Coleophoma crateriformis TaxID=565419 RepID=A0A3D8T0H9_9HELO|nr:V-type proton ATPase subunit e-like protein [Coleophoma crateriformis]
MATGWAIIIGLIVVVLASVAAWFLSPKGETQTIWRSSLILSFASCYIMWGTQQFQRSAMAAPGLTDLDIAITFMAQWHPLIVPRRGDLRPEFAHEHKM